MFVSFSLGVLEQWMPDLSDFGRKQAGLNENCQSHSCSSIVFHELSLYADEALEKSNWPTRCKASNLRRGVDSEQVV